MLQMVRTLAQFSIALEEMNENGENTGDEGGGGERDGGGGGEEVGDRDAVDQIRNNNRNSSRNMNGNGLCAGSPKSNGEVCFIVSLQISVCVCSLFVSIHLAFTPSFWV